MKQSEVSLPQAEELVVRYLSPKEVKPYRNNPKKHSEKQVQQIVNSIKEFRFNNPILIDENNELIEANFAEGTKATFKDNKLTLYIGQEELVNKFTNEEIINQNHLIDVVTSIGFLYFAEKNAV